MTDEEFIKVISDDLCDFIMTHDVKAEDIEDYLLDVLDLLMIDEELIGGSSNPASVQYMASYTEKVIEDLQNKKKNKIEWF